MGEDRRKMARQAPTNLPAERYEWHEPTYSKSEMWVVWLLWVLPILATVVTVVLMVLKFLGSGGAVGIDLARPLGT